ncbi:histamine H2 receptor-like [Actinia tenebrosa]|uniref:Histamine H2 receptor-like n=1 Tax=Actinia tenebrosa TaxID=6105 RepID=A0A6P8I962_ACTTE|nr:histamine H2 receptor-like [Actinia tenebrosa]XP_031561190.1 histamine H2 receptor-like [Actinia tenebrosa]
MESNISIQSQCSANLVGVSSFVFIILNGISGFASIIGNSLVVLVIFKTKVLRTTSNFFISSLALADLIVGLIINPLYIVIISHNVWLEQHPLMKMENFLWIHSLTATTFSLCLVSVERYVAISRPFRYPKNMNKKRCFFVVLTMWFFSLCMGSLSLGVQEKDLALLWVVCSSLVVFPPLTVIAVCYYKIFKIARRHEKRIEKDTIQETAFRVKNQKATWTIVIIVGLFVILFTPSLVFSYITLAQRDKCQEMKVYRQWIWAIFVNFSGSAINPWIYAIRNKDFKRVLTRIYGFRINHEPLTLIRINWKVIFHLRSGSYAVNISKSTLSE